MADLSTTKEEVVAVLQQLLGSEPPVLDSSSNVNEIIKALLTLRQFAVQVVVARCKVDPPRAISQELWQRVGLFLSTMLNLDLIDPRMKSEAKLDIALKVLFNPEHRCPTDVAKVAKFVYDKLEAENWGAGEAEDDETNKEKARKSDDKAGSLVLRKNSSAGSQSGHTGKTVTYPHDTDPIYGLDGIMHHILRIRGPHMTSYQINPTWVSPDAKFFGHGWFLVGACWATQMACLRDGVHGQRMAGISGNISAGTFSIVVSGMYGDLDKDLGDTIYYSGSNSHNNISDTPASSNGTKALEISIKTKKPIRVLRSSQSKWSRAPEAGLRYDGLYTVVEFDIERNLKGGAYKRFKLTRNDDQDPIDCSQPDQRMVRLIKMVPEGYTRTRPAPAKPA